MAAGRRDRGDGRDGRAPVVISSPEDLIASVPAMLGFPPGPGSVVVVCGRTADGGQGPVVRMDVEGLADGAVAFPDEDDGYDLTEEELEEGPEEGSEEGPGGRGPRPRTDPAAFPGSGPARGLARFCAREGVSEVHLVVVHEDCADGYRAGLRAEDVAAAFEYWLGLAGTRVAGAYGVGEFARGAGWVDLFGMVRGVQADPDTTEIAAVHAFDGRVRAGSRDEIDRLYRDRDAGACDVDPHGRREVRLGSPREVARAVESHRAAAARLEAGEEVDDDELAAIGRVLLDIGVRDEVYRALARQGLGDLDGRRALWWALARRRPGRERSVALVLLGAAAYFDGSGVHAWSALAAALEADPGNSLAGLLLHGLQHGLPPERLRRVAVA